MNIEEAIKLINSWELIVDRERIRIIELLKRGEKYEKLWKGGK